jgi:hypothetical protein
MSRTNLKRSATSQAGRTPTRRGVVLTGVLLSTLAVGALWMRSAEPQTVVSAPTAVAAAPVAGPAYSPAPTALSAPPLVAAKNTPRVASTPGQPADAAMPAAAAGQRAYLDPKTGRLREAEHDDAVVSTKASAPSRQARTGTVQTSAMSEPMLGPGGAVGMAVPEDLQTYMVATRQPDGRVVLEHATGLKAANAKVRSGAARKTSAKEEPNDR